MNIYLLPDNLISDIERMINAYWWGSGSDNRGIRWLAWDKLACSKDEGGLGFRDFHSFNMAMVAKQGWNFMHNPTSLVARLFKARYFPNNSFLSSSIGNNPSFAWRSIWRARQVLLLGCRWQIGDGSKIKVMNEPWLRTTQGKCLYAPQNRHVYDLKVHDLLLSNVKCWDENKINSLFPIDVAQEIITVPLFEVVREDKLIWSEEKDGVYSVRTGYRKFMEANNKGYRGGRVEGWSSIWKIHAPPKTKHLLWRICRECLPTRSRLRDRFVQCPVACPLCSTEEENDWHLLFNCGAVKDAWTAMGLAHIIDPRLLIFNNPRDLIFDLCRQASDVEKSKTAVLLWFLWQHRNNKVWAETNASAYQVGVQAASSWQQWAEVTNMFQQQQQSAQHSASDRSSLQWQHPPNGILKCNVDASFYNLAGATGWGWILRDYRGQFKLAGTNILHSPLNVLEGEAMALKEAMEEMIHRGLSHVIFESDSKVVVDAIASRQVGVSEFSIVISHIQSLLLTNSYFEVKFVKRQANKVAHSLARAAYSMSSRRVFESIPRCIATYLNNEIC
jgi:ribonuclease HI